MNTLKKHEHRVIIRIPTYDRPVYFSDLEMHQEIRKHTRFRFLWNISEDFKTNSAQALKNFQNFLDMEIVFCFYTTAGKGVYYKGVITQMEMENRDGATIGYWISGKSKTIVMDDFAHNRIHLQKSLTEIIKDTFKNQIPGLWDLDDIRPRYKDEIRSSMQSNESDWSYITRLVQQYGEWFYYDGQKIAFSPKESGIVLKNGNTLRKFGMSVSLTSNKTALSGYDYYQGVVLGSEQEHTKDHFSDDLMTTAIAAQRRQYERDFSEMPYSYYTPEPQDQKEIDRMRHLAVSAKASQMVLYKGTIREPINIGSIITLEDNGVLHAVIITECVFKSIGTGNLTNEFIGIPADCQYPPYTDPLARGFAYSQSAVVAENDDPEGLGRVKVRYSWHRNAYESISDWLRVSTQYAGNGKGSYCLPEIGEEVRVSFEGGHPDAPYVSGANYNGKEKSGFATPGNDIKAFQTRSGIKTEYNDAEGSLKHEDASGSSSFMDGKGNIVITAPNNMTLNVGKDFTINVGNNTFIEVTKELQILVNTIKETVVASKDVNIGTDLTETTGTTKHITEGDITFISSAIATFFGAIDTKVNKG